MSPNYDVIGVVKSRKRGMQLKSAESEITKSFSVNLVVEYAFPFPKEHLFQFHPESNAFILSSLYYSI